MQAQYYVKTNQLQSSRHPRRTTAVKGDQSVTKFILSIALLPSVC